MQVSIKPIITSNVNKTAVYQNFLTNCGKISFQSDRLESSPDKDCFIKSCDDKINEISCGDQNIYEDIFPDLNPESRNLLNENSYEIALKNVDIPIITVDEYREVIDRIKNSKCINGYPFFRFNDDLETEYVKASEKELGLLPYVGGHDRSNTINEFLSRRLKDLAEIKKRADNKEFDSHYYELFEPENYGVMEDMVRALDYSLSELDDEFGKYDGIVYRQGYMDTGCGQYFSASSNPQIVAFREDPSTADYSVIRTKNGHKIVDFQRKMGSTFAKSESEILLDRKSKYRQLSQDECDEELLRAKELLADNLFMAKDVRRYLSGYTREQILDLIKVYDEI